MLNDVGGDWVGANYAQSRFLILGESAYAVDDGDGVGGKYSSTQHVTSQIMEFDRRNLHFTKLTRALCGKEEPSERERAVAWSKVAYSNFIPGWLDSRDLRHRPDEQQWKAAEASFSILIERLQPARIAVLAWPDMNLWKHVHSTVALSEELQAYRRKDNQLSWCLLVGHPSISARKAGIAFRWADVHLRLKLFLQLNLPDEYPDCPLYRE